jgi:hypothetical protein
MARAAAPLKKVVKTAKQATKTIKKAEKSFMLSVALGGTRKSVKKFVRKGRPLWDKKQLAPQQWLS